MRELECSWRWSLDDSGDEIKPPVGSSNVLISREKSLDLVHLLKIALRGRRFENLRANRSLNQGRKKGENNRG
jgi:hypothetical protein